MFACAWLWIYAGALLLLLELVAPGFILCFFGLAACSVGVCRFFFGEAFGPTWQLAAFSAFSVLYILALRRWLKSTFMGSRAEAAGIEQEYVGRCGRVIEPIRPPLVGRIVLGDSEWSAVSDETLAAGTDVRVVAQQNLTLKVEKI